MTTTDGRLPPDIAACEPTGQTVRVWDAVVRVCHWSIVTLFVLAYVIEEPLILHLALGYALCAVLAIRLAWGVVGSQHARFTDFVPSPSRLRSFLRDMTRGREARYLGHNPAGGLMVVALIIMLIVICGSGVLLDMPSYRGQDWMEELHEGAVSVALLLVALHIAGVIYTSLRHRENLVRAMWSGVKARLDANDMARTSDP